MRVKCETMMYVKLRFLKSKTKKIRQIIKGIATKHFWELIKDLNPWNQETLLGSSLQNKKKKKSTPHYTIPKIQNTNNKDLNRTREDTSKRMMICQTVSFSKTIEKVEIDI